MVECDICPFQPSFRQNRQSKVSCSVSWIDSIARLAKKDIVITENDR